MKWRFIAALLPLALFVAILLPIDLDHMISIGGDDGFELMKEMLVARQPAMATNDVE